MLKHKITQLEYSHTYLLIIFKTGQLHIYWTKPLRKTFKSTSLQNPITCISLNFGVSKIFSDLSSPNNFPPIPRWLDSPKSTQKFSEWVRNPSESNKTPMQNVSWSWIQFGTFYENKGSCIWWSESPFLFYCSTSTLSPHLLRLKLLNRSLIPLPYPVVSLSRFMPKARITLILVH